MCVVGGGGLDLLLQSFYISLIKRNNILLHKTRGPISFLTLKLILLVSWPRSGGGNIVLPFVICTSVCRSVILYCTICVSAPFLKLSR